MVKPDLTNILSQSGDPTQLTETISSRFLKPNSILSLGVFVLCGMILRIFPSAYFYQLITTLITTLSFGFYIALTYFPPNKVLRLLLYALVVIFGLLLLHTFLSLQTPSSLTILLGDSLPFLLASLRFLILRAGIWGLVSVLLLGTGYAIFKNYPLRNGISRWLNSLIIIDYLTYTSQASISVCIGMELLYSLLFHLQLVSMNSNPRVFKNMSGL